MMETDTFVQGVLEDLQGAYSIYHEIVFRLPTGRTMPLFYTYSRHEAKADEQISRQLTVGASYKMLILRVSDGSPARSPA